MASLRPTAVSPWVMTYDALARLTDAALAAGDTVTFTYDPVGNRLSEALPDADAGIGYAYAPQSNRLSAVGDETLGRDAAGHRTSDRHM